MSDVKRDKCEIIPDGTTEITDGAYMSDNDLASVVIPNSVIKIGAEAFSGCTNLVRVTIPDSVKEIGARAFFGCNSLKRVTLPNGIKTIGECAFENCTGIECITIPGSLKTIGSYVFRGISASCEKGVNVTIKHGVKRIASNAFHESNIENLVISESIERIDEKAFYGGRIVNIFLPDRIIEIDPAALPISERIKRIYIPLEASHETKSTLKESLINAGIKPEQIWWKCMESMTALEINVGSIEEVKLHCSDYIISYDETITIGKEYDDYYVKASKYNNETDKMYEEEWDAFLDSLLREYLLYSWKRDYTMAGMDLPYWEISITFKSGSTDIFKGNIQYPEYCRWGDVYELFDECIV